MREPGDVLVEFGAGGRFWGVFRHGFEVKGVLSLAFSLWRW